jgi:hypothetical protein
MWSSGSRRAEAEQFIADVASEPNPEDAVLAEALSGVEAAPEQGACFEAKATCRARKLTLDRLVSSGMT